MNTLEFLSSNLDQIVRQFSPSVLDLQRTGLGRPRLNRFDHVFQAFEQQKTVAYRWLIPQYATDRFTYRPVDK